MSVARNAHSNHQLFPTMSNRFTLEMNDLATSLIQQTNPSLSSRPEANRIAISQTQHRLNLLTAWFGSLDKAQNALLDKTVLEIGCGQGDMTVALAWAVGPKGKVFAIDPAPLDYGSPETLREAQHRITNSSPLGGRVDWIQSAPIKALKQNPELRAADYIVLAHSLLYMESTDYVGELFRDVRSAAEPVSSRLLIAEWGMRVSSESAEAHLYAVQAQAAQPLKSGNVQLYLEPKVTRELAANAGWQAEEERWIESPEVDDGAWEVAAAKSMAVADDSGDAVRGSFRIWSALLRDLRDVWMFGRVFCIDMSSTG